MPNSRDDMALVVAEMNKPSGENDGQGREITTIDNDSGAIVEAEREQPAGDTGRDSTGRFVSKTSEEEQVPADGKPAPQGKVVPAPRPANVTAPVSWKPEEREHWGQMKPEAQAAVLRREREVEAALRTTAAARQHFDEFNRVVQPVAALIQAEGSTPMGAFNEFLRTSVALRTAPPMVKAKEIANLVHHFGINLEMLDAAISANLKGQPIQTGPAAEVAALLDQRLAPVMQFIDGVQKTRQVTEQESEQAAQATWDAFVADPKNEFAEDVQEEIAAILELGVRRGQVVSLQDAYSRAILLHPTISQIVATRQQASGAAQQTAAARRAQNAAASIPSNGGAPSREGESEGDGSLRSDLQSAWVAASNRR